MYIWIQTSLNLKTLKIYELLNGVKQRQLRLGNKWKRKTAGVLFFCSV